MNLRNWRFAALLLAGLGLIMGGAHLLEMPVKMQYDGDMYAAVTSTLYQYFGWAGAVITIAAIASSGVVTYMMWRRPGYKASMFGTLCLLASFGLWLMIVAPVNADWAYVMQNEPEIVSQSFLALRNQWEYGHLAAFAAWLMGFVALLRSVLIDTPKHVITEPAAEPERERERELVA